MRLRNLLVLHEPYAATADAVACAANLARIAGGRLNILTVFDKKIARAGASGPVPLELKRLAVPRYDGLEPLGCAQSLSGIRATLAVAVGDFVGEAIRYIGDHRPDIVLVASQRRPCHGRFAQPPAVTLMRKCPCPVWIVNGKPGPVRRVVATLGFDNLNPQSFRLDETVIRTSIEMARLQDAELHIVHAWHLDGEATFRMRSDLSRGEIRQVFIEGGRQRLDEVLEFLSGFDLHQVRYDVHFTKGDPADVIPKVAAAKHADLIVMGTSGRSGLSGFLFGNLAEAMLHRVGCSVMAVKPLAPEDVKRRGVGLRRLS